MKKHLFVSPAVVLGLLTGHSAHAINPSQLIGDWQVETNGTCPAPGGFDAHLHPLNPSQSIMAQWTTFGDRNFWCPNEHRRQWYYFGQGNSEFLRARQYLRCIGDEYGAGALGEQGRVYE